MNTSNIAIAIEDYQAKDEKELSFNQGEIFQILNTTENYFGAKKLNEDNNTQGFISPNKLLICNQEMIKEYLHMKKYQFVNTLPSFFFFLFFFSYFIMFFMFFMFFFLEI